MNDYTKKAERPSQPAPMKKERQKKVISGNAELQKKSAAQRVLNMFISEDIDDVKAYLVHDILIPWAREALFSAVDGLIHGRGYAIPSDMASRVSYNGRNSSHYSYDRASQRRETRFNDSDEVPYGNVIVKTRGEAEKLLTVMDDIMATYGVVSVLDLYDLAGLDTSQSDTRYGWENIRSAKVVRLRDGRYLVKMPRVIPLDTPWD